jgi:SagB-type dehydrogenase family enzyme
MKEDVREQYRYFLRDSVRFTIDFHRTDQSRGIAPPPIEKPFPTDGTRIDLVPKNKCKGAFRVDLARAVSHRQSHRHYRTEAVTIEELSFLLWATQGVRRMVDQATAYRNVPSAGCRHALETYLCVLNVSGLEKGMYRYLPLEHQLLFLYSDRRLSENIVDAALGQPFPGKAPVTFIWTAVPYRMEWRYDIAAHKVILLDAGHVCQNLYLACEAIGAGTCAVAAYHQDLMDRLVRVDGEEEFAIYLAPVGKV